MNNDDRKDSLTLEILETIENQKDITQRHLADNLGVALGLTNSYLKRCIRKGYVKIKQVPANRYLYYLTPKGFAEKSRLTAQYLVRSFDFYRNAGNTLNHIYKICLARGWSRILLCGISELAEIASLRAQEHDIVIIGIYDPVFEKKEYIHFPVWQSLKDADPYDACLLTSINDTENIYASIIRQVDRERVLIPSILGLNHQEIAPSIDS
jgi:DNA-binding MarR family transcriptional regulator